MARFQLSPVGVAVGAYIVADVLHAADHVRQGRPLVAELYAVGSVGLVAAVIVLFLALRGSRLAAPAAAAFGLAATVGVFAIHLMPAWGLFSDSYLPLHLDAISWFSVELLFGTAVAMGVVGLSAMRPRENPLPA